LTREHVLRGLADLDAGVSHPFGQPTGYELVHEGSRYAPKAAIGLACRHLLGRILGPEDFSGGEAPGQANFVLRKLGFTVVRKGEPVEGEAGKDWSGDEVRLAVADYFAMLGKELLGKPFNKSEHRTALRAQLAGRSDGSVEFKHANISAVLVGLGLPYIEGYKPRGNFQSLLAQEVETYLAGRPDYLQQLADGPVVSPEKAPATSFDAPNSLFEGPPEGIILPEPGKPWVTRRPRRVDFAERDATNRLLGKLGEE